MSEWKRTLYKAVQDAREHTCGSTPSNKRTILRKLGRCESLCRELNVPTMILLAIQKAYRIVNDAKDYYERLLADDILCELLNTELGD